MSKTFFSAGPLRWLSCLTVLLSCAASVNAQSVCLPAPRLLTTLPMGGQAGTQVEVTITGENLDETGELSFSHPALTAQPVLDAAGKPVPNRYLVTIAAECPPGLHEARIMTRLGLSSSRIFNVSELPEVTHTAPRATVEQAAALQVNSVCNAVLPTQSVDHYVFKAIAGQRILVDCAAQGIDSKLKPVLIVADATGADLLVERRGGAIDFTAPATADYVVKVHDLTYNGGAACFYRLVLKEVGPEAPLTRLPATRTVSSFSWPPQGLSEEASLAEAEPNNRVDQAQKISLPCDISGSFYPAADVDTYEFTAKAGEVWWVEVASERLGLSTDPSIIVQHVNGSGPEAVVTDVAELNDIASPMKISSNGYSYDGPPYNAGSTDIIGKVEIKQDGVHRLQILDLFGGTRSDPGNVYRLIVRKAEPDFALAGWALHMNLRNGDRNALSKPIALRGGATMPIEVVVVRRDGFDGEIQLSIDNLPEGVTSAGVKIAAGQSRGILTVTAAADAPRGLTSAEFYGTATINGEQVKRPCQLASMKWPVPNAAAEIPSPRLLMDVPVSVCAAEQAPLSLAAAEEKVWEASVGEKITIPYNITRRCDFSGNNVSLYTFCSGMVHVPAFDIDITKPTFEAVIDLAALKVPAGEHTLAFYGGAVAKYRDYAEGVTLAEAELQQAQKNVEVLKTEVQSLTELVQTVTEAEKANVQKQMQASAEKLKQAEAAVTAADKQLKAATARAQPKDIVDIVVTKPVTIRVLPAEKK